MAIGVDRVQVTKVESAAGGGQEGQDGPYGGPVPLDPQEDAIESAGIYLQDESNRDENVGIFRDSDDLKLFDPSLGSKSISQLFLGDLPKDYIEASITLTIEANRQYIIYNKIILDGRVINDGVGVVF